MLLTVDTGSRESDLGARQGQEKRVCCWAPGGMCWSVLVGLEFA
jgi:hypothetical protein